MLVILLNLVMGNTANVDVSSRQLEFYQASHRTVCDSLPSYGSSYTIYFPN